MLNGIGGRTIAEAKERLSYPEFVSWAAYRNKLGSLNVGIRVETGSALLASLYASRYSKEPMSIYDFAPHLYRPAISLDEAMKTWV